MYPFMFNPFCPPVRKSCLNTLRTFKVNMSGINTENDTTDLLVPAIVYNQLPNECILLFNVTQGIPESVETNEVNVVTGTTVVRRFQVVDSQNAVIDGTIIPEPTQLQIYLNKSAGIFRILNYIPAAAEA